MKREQKTTDKTQEPGQGATQTPEALPEVVRAYDSLICAGQAITRMMAGKTPETLTALAKAHRAVVDARQALLPLVADAMKAAKP